MYCGEVVLAVARFAPGLCWMACCCREVERKIVGRFMGDGGLIRLAGFLHRGSWDIHAGCWDWCGNEVNGCFCTCMGTDMGSWRLYAVKIIDANYLLMRVLR